MKRIFSALLVVVFALSFFTVAVAETSQVPVKIDLTGLIVAIMFAAFDFLLAWLLKAVVPPLKKWLDAHTTKSQQQLLWNVVRRLVAAAEQTITGSGMGAQKLAYVKSALDAAGYTVDPYVIEAAVKEMNDRGEAELIAKFGLDDPDDFDDYLDDIDN